MEAQAVDREGLFARNRHLCRRGARRFLRRGLERADLEQVAAIGLIKARDRYDDCLGTPFAVYAWRMILSELGHHVRDHEHLVRPPRRLRALERRYWAEWERLNSSLEREPIDEELAAALGTPPRTVVDIRHLRVRLQRTGAADAPLLNAAPPAPAGSPALDADELLCLRQGMASLSLLERRVLIGTYWCELPRAALARKLGVCPDTILNLPTKSLRRLPEFFCPR